MLVGLKRLIVFLPLAASTKNNVDNQSESLQCDRCQPQSRFPCNVHVLFHCFSSIGGNVPKPFTPLYDQLEAAKKPAMILRGYIHNKTRISKLLLMSIPSFCPRKIWDNCYEDAREFPLVWLDLSSLQ